MAFVLSAFLAGCGGGGGGGDSGSSGGDGGSGGSCSDISGTYTLAASTFSLTCTGGFTMTMPLSAASDTITQSGCTATYASTGEQVAVSGSTTNRTITSSGSGSASGLTYIITAQETLTYNPSGASGSISITYTCSNGVVCNGTGRLTTKPGTHFA